MALVAEVVALPTFELIAAAATPIIAVGVALQAAGVVVTALSFYKLCKQSKKVRVILGNNKTERTLEQYRRGVEYLTRERTTKKERFKEAFFGVLQKGHKEKLKKLYERVAEGSLPVSRLKTAFDDVQYYVRNKKAQHLLSIALLITAIAGLTLLFLTPLCPIVLFPLGWAMVGVSCVGGLLLTAFSVYNNIALNRFFKSHLRGPESPN